MTAFSGTSVLFYLFSGMDFFYLIGSFMVIFICSGRVGGYLFVNLLWVSLGFTIDLHNGIYMSEKWYWSNEFGDAPTCNISSLVILLIMVIGAVIIYKNHSKLKNAILKILSKYYLK